MQKLSSVSNVSSIQFQTTLLQNNSNENKTLSPNQSQFYNASPFFSQQCLLCEKQKKDDCPMCNGTGSISQHFDAFVKYVLNYKLGLVSDYKNQPSFEKKSFPKDAEQSVNEETMCDKCSQHPFVGKRYHCLICQDYDECEQCFNTFPHPHQMEQIQSSSSKCNKSLMQILKQSMR